MSPPGSTTYHRSESHKPVYARTESFVGATRFRSCLLTCRQTQATSPCTIDAPYFGVLPHAFSIGQVEVDAPGGESLAFTLHHGEEEGMAVVDFCRVNAEVLPDEQACVVMLMQEIAA